MARHVRLTRSRLSHGEGGNEPQSESDRPGSLAGPGPDHWHAPTRSLRLRVVQVASVEPVPRAGILAGLRRRAGLGPRRWDPGQFTSVTSALQSCAKPSWHWQPEGEGLGL